MEGTIYEKLSKARQQVIREIQSLNNEKLNAKPAPDEWSIAQICYHLVLVELATIKAIKAGLKKESKGKPERKDVSTTLDRSEKIKAPRAVQPDDRNFELHELLDSFANSRNQLIWTLQGIEDKSVLKEKSLHHPGFGELALDQWVELIPYHELRHLEQIREVREKI